MKNALSTLFLICLLFSCTGDDQTTTPRLWLKIQDNLIGDHPQYNYKDMNIVVYMNFEDWANEKNEIFKGKFDENGEIEISGLNQKFYYVDIFSDDNFLSNWYDLPEDNGSISNSYSPFVQTNKTTNIPTNVFINEGVKTRVGHWEFYEGGQLGVPYDTEDRSFLGMDIYKDYRLVVTDSYKEKIYKAHYEFKLSDSYVN